jgi:hypothetical protein
MTLEHGPCYKRPIKPLLAALIALPLVSAAWFPTLRAQQPAASGGSSSLDFDVFKSRVLPILTSVRKGNARCTACHSRAGGNSFLEPLAPGATIYTDEQARRNFDRIQRLVVPGEPLKSILLLNPLAEEAGGSHWHSGGKHWQSQGDPEWQVLAAWVSAKAAAPAKPGLNFETFRTRVQPILTSRRQGHARCTACHSRAGGNSFLEPLAPGASTYTTEQSRRNFDRIQRLVVAGEPSKSILLMNPLAEEAGGSHWHGGGKHWASQRDPEFQVLAAWVRGE